MKELVESLGCLFQFVALVALLFGAVLMVVIVQPIMEEWPVVQSTTEDLRAEAGNWKAWAIFSFYLVFVAGGVFGILYGVISPEEHKDERSTK